MTQKIRWQLMACPRLQLKTAWGGSVPFCQRFRPSLEALEDRTLPAVIGMPGPDPLPVIDLTAQLANKPNFSFSTIQAAVSAASPGDTILVNPGTYAESVTIDKPLTLEGANYGINPSTGTRGAESIVDTSIVGGSTPFDVTASNVTIDGFTIEGATDSNTGGFGIVLAPGTSGTTLRNNVIQNNVAGLSLANDPSTFQYTVIQDNLFQNNNEPGPLSGTAVYTDEFNAGGPLANVLIDSNTFTNNQGVALSFAAQTDSGTPYDSNVTISNNTIANNGSGIFLASASNVAITANTISSSRGDAIDVGGGVSGLTIAGNSLASNGGTAVNVGPDVSGVGHYSQPSSNVTLALNSILHNGGDIQIDSADGRYVGTLNASGNWWGTALGSSPSTTTNDQLGQIEELMSGPVHVGSFLDSGVNVATVGFTPAPATQMWVPRTTASSGLPIVDGNIQDALNSALSGMTVSVAADTYAERLTVGFPDYVIDSNGGVVNVSGLPAFVLQIITQPFTILGASAGLDALTRYDDFPSTASGPKADPTQETVLTPPASNPSNGALVSVQSSGVILDGLVFDGNNPGTPHQGTLVGGIPVDAANAITTAGAQAPVNQVTVQNSIFQNFAGTAIDLDSGNPASPTSGNQFLDNVVSNVGNTDLAGVPTINLSQQEQFLFPGEDLAKLGLSGSVANPGPGWTAQVSYNDDGTSSSFQDLALQPDGSFTLQHSYPIQGLNLVTVKVTDGNGNVATSSFYVSVLDNADDVESVTARVIQPGQTETFNPVTPNSSWTTAITYGDSGSGPTLVQVVDLASASPNTVTLDIQGMNVKSGDPLTITITGVAQEPAPDAIYFVDPITGAKQLLSWTYQNGTLTITFNVGTDPSDVNITGTVFVINLPSSTEQNVTVAAALASASPVDPGFEQTASFISRTQLTVSLTASQDRQVSSSATTQNVQTNFSLLRIRRGGPEDEQDPDFWEQFSEKLKGLLESLQMPAKGSGEKAPPPKGPAPAQGKGLQPAPEQPGQPAEPGEGPVLPPPAPPADEQPLAACFREGQEIAPAEVLALQPEPVAPETDLFGQALLAGALTFPLFAPTQETTHKRQPTLPSVGLPC